MTDAKLAKLKRSIVPVIKKHDIKKAALFGSVLRGKRKKKSDIDILVQFPSGKTLFDLVALEHDLEHVLECDVDVVSYKALHPYMRKQVLKDQYVVYER